MQLDRREFLGALAVAAAATEGDAQTAPSSWGGPVLGHALFKIPAAQT